MWAKYHVGAVSSGLCPKADLKLSGTDSQAHAHVGLAGWNAHVTCKAALMISLCLGLKCLLPKTFTLARSIKSMAASRAVAGLDELVGCVGTAAGCCMLACTEPAPSRTICRYQMCSCSKDSKMGLWMCLVPVQILLYLPGCTGLMKAVKVCCLRLPSLGALTESCVSSIHVHCL